MSLLNPSGSIKDVMAAYMLKQAEKKKLIKPGGKILEVTTGNTGIAFSMLSSVKGYEFIAVMPEHMSIERRQMMRAFGARIVITPKDLMSLVRSSVMRSLKMFILRHGFRISSEIRIILRRTEYIRAARF